uniref:Fc receptor gamma-chain n=1 Tax=Dicentrarchus labrax TaxID=13489 RepID=A0A8C4GI53_DICLA
MKMVCFLCPEAIEDMNICYVLDGILILYGIILTVLYCRLRSRTDPNACSNDSQKSQFPPAFLHTKQESDPTSCYML